MASRNGRAKRSSSAQELQILFEGLIGELDKAIARLEGQGPGDETWEQLQRVRAEAEKGIALVKKLGETPD